MSGGEYMIIKNRYLYIIHARLGGRGGGAAEVH